MTITPQNSTGNIYAQNLAKPEQAAPGKAAAHEGAPAAAAAGDTLKLSSLAALRQEPEIRPDVVAKGKELLNDPNFPSKEMMRDMAKLIVPFADDE